MLFCYEAPGMFYGLWNFSQLSVSMVWWGDNDTGDKKMKTKHTVMFHFVHIAQNLSGYIYIYVIPNQDTLKSRSWRERVQIWTHSVNVFLQISMFLRPTDLKQNPHCAVIHCPIGFLSAALEEQKTPKITRSVFYPARWLLAAPCPVLKMSWS